MPVPEALAREKLTRVFGAAHGDSLLRRLLAELGIPTLATMEDLDRFAQRLKALGAIEAGVAAALSVHALRWRIQQLGEASGS